MKITGDNGDTIVLSPVELAQMVELGLAKGTIDLSDFNTTEYDIDCEDFSCSGECEYPTEDEPEVDLTKLRLEYDKCCDEIDILLGDNYVMSITSDGYLRRSHNLSPSLGFKLDAVGRILDEPRD